MDESDFFFADQVLAGLFPQRAQPFKDLRAGLECKGARHEGAAIGDGDAPVTPPCLPPAVLVVADRGQSVAEVEQGSELSIAGLHEAL